MNRRELLRSGVAGLFVAAAPALVRAASLMAVSPIPSDEWWWEWRGPDGQYRAMIKYQIEYAQYVDAGAARRLW